MTHALTTYVVYLITTLSLTIWVGKTLYKNGKVFLDEIFHGNQLLAISVNNLLLVGFYLVNIGYAVYTLKVSSTINSYTEVVETLSVKVGFIILLLGAMHFFNLFILFRLRSKAHNKLASNLPHSNLKL